MGLLRTTAGTDDVLVFGPVTRGPGGADIDLTTSGTKLWFTARAGYGGTPLIEKDYGVTTVDTANGITVNDPTTTAKNMLTVQIAGEDTAGIEKTQNLIYDVFLQEPGGRDSMIFRGELQVRAAVRATA